ncbi:26307_t:CDS:2, partial [Gigaspora margarita]
SQQTICKELRRILQYKPQQLSQKELRSFHRELEQSNSSTLSKRPYNDVDNNN